jgi:penicillin G amidase
MSFQSRDTKATRWLRLGGVVLAALALLLVIAAASLYFAVRASLPILDGRERVPGVTTPVTVSRDAQGTVIIDADSRDDAMRALGFVHAQERFFEMDLARRAAAGELSELLGEATVKMDEAKRIHRFRARFKETLGMLRYGDQALLNAYAEGVNAGLASLPVRPWQYLLLRSKPRAWEPIDSLLVNAEMYTMLQGRTIELAFSDALMAEQLSPKLRNWLRPRGGTWDAALDGSVMPAAAMPTVAELDMRKAPALPTQSDEPAAKSMRPTLAQAYRQDAENLLGSNAWAITGDLTKHGGAMLANDMHLGLQVPNIWFRAQLRYERSGQKRTVVGVTLPGIPAVVAGSNGDIAWGFSNAYGKWLDWVPAAGLPVTEAKETILVAGGKPVTLTVRQTSAGPIVKSYANRDYALAWMAHRPGAINIRMASIASASSVDEALEIAQGAGMPHQNTFVVDRLGNAAWTISGVMSERDPKRSDARAFAKLADVAYPELDPKKYPVVKNPKDGRLWSGNNRKLGGGADVLIGEGGGDLGARAQQIRDRLKERSSFTEQELIAIQYDNESRFLKRWVAPIQFSAAEANNPASAAMLAALKNWNGRADVDQVGHRVVRAFRNRVHDQLWRAWINALAPPPNKMVVKDDKFEYAAWAAITDKPLHLLPQPFATWEEFLSAQAVYVRDELVKAEGSIEKATWGNRNKAVIKHPFSRILPALSPYLDMPATPLAGDNNMPAVLVGSFGASEHMAVSPGREADGILTMPGGQSGHPLSPFYGAGHDDWVKQKPAPLLAGPSKHELILAPPPNR